ARGTTAVGRLREAHDPAPSSNVHGVSREPVTLGRIPIALRNRPVTAACIFYNPKPGKSVAMRAIETPRIAISLSRAYEPIDATVRLGVTFAPSNRRIQACAQQPTRLAPASQA